MSEQSLTSEMLKMAIAFRKRPIQAQNNRLKQMASLRNAVSKGAAPQPNADITKIGDLFKLGVAGMAIRKNITDPAMRKEMLGYILQRRAVSPEDGRVALSFLRGRSSAIKRLAPLIYQAKTDQDVDAISRRIYRAGNTISRAQFIREGTRRPEFAEKYLGKNASVAGLLGVILRAFEKR